MAGPRVIAGERAKSTQWDVFEFIEAGQMRSWSRADRIGNRLSVEIGLNGERIDRQRIYTLDVELWHPGLTELARQKIVELETLVGQDRVDQERFSDRFVENLLAVARVSVSPLPRRCLCSPRRRNQLTMRSGAAHGWRLRSVCQEVRDR